MKKATGPSDYKHIVAWGQIMHSFAYYIEDEKVRAFAAGAPINAIYPQYASDGSGPTGVWVTADQIGSDDTRKRVESIVTCTLFGNIEQTVMSRRQFVDRMGHD